MEQYFENISAGLFSELENFSEKVNVIYMHAIKDYHVYDAIDRAICNPYSPDELNHLFYLKCWIDTVQWHVEDEIRNPQINPGMALILKRRIDSLNQERTNKVESIDNCFLIKYNGVSLSHGARLNSESPAWALDRLSILTLKIYHMQAETDRIDVSQDHIDQCFKKLMILYEQRTDLCLSINELIRDISRGEKYMKVYRQMKMYNDPNLNPVLYKLNKP
jgi:Protein of unknown function (DUF4254)